MRNKEQNIETLSASVLKLMNNLMQFKSADRIMLLYINAINNIFNDINLSFEGPDIKVPNKFYFEISSDKNNYGYLFFDGVIASLPKEKYELLLSSVQMLAYILDSVNTKTKIKESGRNLYKKEIENNNNYLMYKNLSERSPDIILKTDDKLNCLYINKNVEYITNKKPIDLIGENLSNWEIEERFKKSLIDEIKKVIKKNISSLKIISSELYHKIIEFRIVPDFNTECKLISVICIGRDITEKYNIEKELVKAKKRAEESDKLKMAFLANISHEIRTPLNGIIGFARLMAKKEISDERKNDYLKIVESSTNNLLQTMSNILEISKIEAGEFNIYKENISVIDFLSIFYQEYRSKWERSSKTDIKFELSLPKNDNKETFFTDEYRLKEVLQNLVDNAFKFTKSGNIKIGCYYKKDQVIFYVSDTGIGIRNKDLVTIFNRFFQIDNSERKEYSGLGLGLTISKAIIEKLGGKIWIESIFQKGTTIYFNIPLNNNKISSKTEKTKKDGFINIEK